jgi:sortase (surface protein transpeptidase)
MPKENQPSPAKPTRQTQNHRLLAVVTGIGAMLVAYGSILTYDRFVSTLGRPEPPSATPGAILADQPSETKPQPSLVKKYSVPTDQPRSLRIVSAGISGLVQRVGVTKDNAMAVPTNIYYAGWYTGSAKPGQPGLSIIDGHVSGKYADGLFKRIASVKVGSVIEVELGDLTFKKYTVVDLKQLPDAQVPDYLFTKRADIPAQLNLITCGGQFNNATGRYDDRVIVVARRIAI